MNLLPLAAYKTLVFDCDGVVLDSNRIKTEAFRAAALPWGKAAAEALVDYHVANGGVSRYAKFNYFIKELLPEYAETEEGPSIEEMLLDFARHVRVGLESCRVAEGLEGLRERTCNSRWMVVSGGDQAELREVFAARGLDKLFDGGIYGSPDTKATILEREYKGRNLQKPAIFLGDSRYDHEAAAASGLDFIFISQWSEFREWRNYCKSHGLEVIHSPRDLLGLPDPVSQGA